MRVTQWASVAGAICAFGIAGESPFGRVSAHAAPPRMGYSLAYTQYWWRLPKAHTAQESFFLPLMAAEFGEDWLEWMPDPLIAAYWEMFRLYGWMI